MDIKNNRYNSHKMMMGSKRVLRIRGINHVLDGVEFSNITVQAVSLIPPFLHNTLYGLT